jgi:hypothetical protein
MFYNVRNIAWSTLCCNILWIAKPQIKLFKSKRWRNYSYDSKYINLPPPQCFTNPERVGKLMRFPLWPCQFQRCKIVWPCVLCAAIFWYISTLFYIGHLDMVAIVTAINPALFQQIYKRNVHQFVSSFL